jgi:hypothetical protein
MKCKFKFSTVVELGVGAAAIASLLLAGCGGGGSSAVSSSSTELSGIASKGPVANGTITAFSIANGQKDKSLASVTSDNSGSYTLKLGTYTGPVLIEVTGGSYRDEATGNTVTLASTLRSTVAHVAPNTSGSALIKSASVTPITEAAVQNAETKAGGLTPTNIQTANDDVKAQLGFDPVSTQPTDATNPAAATASIAEKTYAALLGTVSQYLKDNPSKSLANASSDFAAVLKSGGGGLTSNALITAAGNNFGVNANNKTGVSNMSALQTLNATLIAPIDDENPISQRIVAAALFNEPSILACGPDSVAEYPNTCSTKYNYNLSGMPGCFSADFSNYIGHYQKNGSGIDWKTPGFLCTETNIYESFVWSMNDGRVMDGAHNGIDFRHKDTTGTNIHPAFYAVTPGIVINAGTGSLNTIAIYLADPSDPTNTSKGITTLYLHASSVNTDKMKPGAAISPGDLLGYQGNSGLGLAAGVGEHVHVSVRSGWVPCASNSCSDGKSYKNGYLPPVATLVTYLNPPTAPVVILSALPTLIANGATSVLNWSSTNSTSCTSSGGGGTGTTGSFTTPSLTTTTTYTVTCTGAGGTTSQAVTVTVAGALAPTVTFSASPSSIASGATSTLNWSSTNSASCALSGGSGTGTAGSFTTPPLTATTTYTVTCTGPGGTAQQSTTVTVAGALAPTVTLTALPSSIAYGATSTLNWSSTNSTSCTSTGGGGTGTTGSFTTPSLTTTTTHTVTCTGAGGTASQAATVTVAAPPAPTGTLNDTGITASQCYQAGSDVLVACNSAGAIALNNAQDGMAGRDANAATNSNTDGKLGFSFSAVPGGCVQDNVTGLMWEVKTMDGGLRDWNKTYTNYSATYNPYGLYYGTATDASGFVGAVNATNLCGYSDWRLPTADELQSIVDYGVAYPGPTIDATWFSNTKNSHFWSTTPISIAGYSDSYAVVVNFSDGLVNDANLFFATSDRFNSYYVRLVRAGQPPTQPRYIVSADGQEVTDRQTSLIWRRCAEGMNWNGSTCAGVASAFTHEAALQRAAAQASSTGIAWRLPNVKELASIADKSLSNPAIDPTAFPATPATLVNWFWSASAAAVDGSPYAAPCGLYGIACAWYVDFNNFNANGGPRSVSGYARLVRNAP